uniref:KAP NTPase domain-containing protein n=1 Tax=Ciona intestinalis TaxID=7719 RepID=F6YPY1_CIOIN
MKTIGPYIIHDFVEQGNVGAIRDVLLKHHDFVDQKNDAGLTALHLACKRGHEEIVTTLIEHGYSAMVKDNDDFTALTYACRGGHLACVMVLMQFRPNIEQADVNGWTCLMWAVYKGHPEVVRHLLQEGANVHVSVSYNMTCLLWAAGRGFLDIVKMLLIKGAKVNHADKFGSTALVWASRRGYCDIVQYLLNKKADPNLVGANGCSSLIVAMKGGHEACVRILLSNSRLNVNQADREGQTTLSYATKSGTDEIVNELLEHGAYLNITDNHGDTPLIKAVKHTRLNTVRVLLARFADVNIQGKEGKTALHMACTMGSNAIVQEILNCSPELEIQNETRETALVCAIKQGNFLISEMLVNHGADAGARDANHDTTLHLALKLNNIQLIELLLRDPKNGKLLYQPNKLGETPYDIDAASSNHLLSQIFGSKGFSAFAASNNMHFDLYSCAVAEMLTEPSFETPICIGLYAKWGSGVSFVLDKIKQQINLFTSFLPHQPLQLSWDIYFTIVFLSAFAASIFAFAFHNRLIAGLTTFFVLFGIPFIFGMFVYIGTSSFQWKWTVSSNHYMKKKWSYFKTIQILLFYSSYKKSMGRVRFIFNPTLKLSSVKEEDVVNDQVASLTSVIENSLGSITFRIARGLEFNHSNSVKVARKFCCVPVYLWVVFSLLCINAIVLLVLSLHDPRHICIFLLSSIVALLLLAATPTLIKVISSLLTNPKSLRASRSQKLQRKSIHKICSGFTNTQSRICILVNGLESHNCKLFLRFFNSNHLLFCVPPIITIVCIDNKLFNIALDKSFEEFEINGKDWLQTVVQLPVFLSEKLRKKKFFQTPDSETDSEFKYNRNRRKSHLKKFDLARWMSSDDCFQPITPQILRRITVIQSLTARMLRARGKDFLWSNLSAWIILTEVWPYTVMCLICYVEKVKVAPSRPLKSVYFELAQHYPLSNSVDSGDAESLLNYLSSKCSSILIQDIINFIPGTINLDPKLEELTPNFHNTGSMVSSASSVKLTLKTSDSNLSSVMAGASMPCSDWTVEDVCYHWKCIPGLDKRNLLKYEKFITTNNFNGLVLVSCDVGELKQELNTSFGDWCLIKKFLL